MIQRNLENARQNPPRDLEALRKRMWRDFHDLNRRIKDLQDQKAEREAGRAIKNSELKYLEKKLENLEVKDPDRVGPFPRYADRERVIERTKEEISRLKREIQELDESIRRTSNDIFTLAKQQRELGRYLGPMEGLAH